MRIEKSEYLNSLKPYAFAEVDRAKGKAEREYSNEIIDFGVGDPTESTPSIAVMDGIKEALTHPERGYPSYEGEMDLREAISNWFSKRFKVKLNPQEEITANLGCKQAVFTLPIAYVDQGDLVIIPDPGYPPYTTGAKQRGAKILYCPLREENDFLPYIGNISRGDADKAKIMWINYPNNPTTKIAPEKFLREVIDFCQENKILLASDEAYSEIYYKEENKPLSLFNVRGGRDVGLVFNSLSKRSNMTNYRIGFVAGEKELLDPFKEVQTNIHSGQSQILQRAAIGALSDEKHVKEMRNLYREKKRILIPALKKSGFQKIYSEATIYLWVKLPGEISSLEAVKKLVNEKGINTTPGEALSKTPESGKQFIRFALVPSISKTMEAAERLSKEEIFK